MSRDLKALIRNVPDFPIPGVQFKDITTLLRDGAAFQEVIDRLVSHYQDQRVDVVVGVESRGFIFSAPVAYRLGAGLVPIRKPGKLPAATVEVEYDLEYGANTLQIHADAFSPGARVLIVDDLLATGGTIGAAAELVKRLGGEIVGLAFVIELTFLNGRERLRDYPIVSLIQF
ncbi:adenine phosphoribosyltransferase [Kallotenue papyrolyticum]|uniref:adenine phosphoribosyltransferase n=1 Tax=Kallotenue papyrolyticum TaxID=1325125 RepID=UPI00047855FF|nr:adenine phosphoribosyltransferase [Kallotenue papyrolyticum]